MKAHVIAVEINTEHNRVTIHYSDGGRSEHPLEVGFGMKIEFKEVAR